MAGGPLNAFVVFPYGLECEHSYVVLCGQGVCHRVELITNHLSVALFCTISLMALALAPSEQQLSIVELRNKQISLTLHCEASWF